MDNNVSMAQRYEHEIPDGYEARIEGSKVILERKESVDERIRKCIATIVKVNKSSSFGLECNHGATWDEMLAYLERQKEQKPDGGSSEKPNNHAEWSEEDEHYFQNLIMAVDSTFGDSNTKNWLQNRLKSIRPQSHWKPSEEQLSALKEQTSWLSKDNPLHSLYYQLCEL